MRSSTTRSPRLALLLAATLACGGHAAAQEASQEASQAAAAASSIGLELNSLDPSEKGCRMTFVVANKLGSDLSKAAYEIALFNDKGLVDRMTVLDFQALPDGKTKVRQFDLADTDCAKLGRVLINDATACEGDGIEPGACIENLEATTKTDLDFGT